VIFDLAKSLSWANSRAWAPAMVFRDGRYFFYFVADYKIGVAVGPTPTGPFEDALGRPLLTRDSVSRSSPIDPFAFIDDDGRAYLYFGSGTLFFCRLNPDMITLAGEPTPILARAAHLREALLVFKRKGVYYFMWSENDARSADYQVGYGTSSSPEGPVEIPSDHVILKKRGLAAGTGHHSVIQIPGTDRWYIFYHRHLPAQGAGCLRETCLGRLEFAPDGGIMNVDPLAPVFPPGSKGESFAE
jgi:beta-xylosidase